MKRPAHYTVQFHIAGYAPAQGDDVEHHMTMEQCRRALVMAHDEAERYGAAYEPSEALVWHGWYDDTTDIYPDFVLRMGPRGGVRKESA